jgi:hypothetical protein
MFVQVISGKVKDEAGFRKALDRWEDEIKPGATGFLGSTGGTTEDGRFIALVRFESEAAARKNSERPEQGEWFKELAANIDGEPEFQNCTEVDLFEDGGSDDAGFVQVMQSKGDRKRIADIEAKVMDRMRELRADYLGGLRAWSGDQYTEAAYFRSEKEARAAEKQEMPDDIKANFEEWQKAAGEPTYFDLRDPIFR